MLSRSVLGHFSEKGLIWLIVSPAKLSTTGTGWEGQHCDQDDYTMLAWKS